MNIMQFTHGMDLTGACIVANMPDEYYHNKTPHLSKSQIDLFHRGPAYLSCAAPFEATRAMHIGTAIHTAVLEPERFKADFLMLHDAPDRRCALYRSAATALAAERVFSAPEAERIEGMSVNAQANPDYIRDYASVEKHVELSFFGKCTVTGELIKCRFDMLTTDGQALDLKKTQDISFDKFSRAIAEYRYHVQHAFYSHVYECVTGEPLKSFKFFCIEEKSPHANIIYELCSETEALGKSEMLGDLKYYAEKPDPTTGIWQESSVISLPNWYLDRAITDLIE